MATTPANTRSAHYSPPRAFVDVKAFQASMKGLASSRPEQFFVDAQDIYSLPWFVSQNTHDITKRPPTNVATSKHAYM